MEGSASVVTPSSHAVNTQPSTSADKDATSDLLLPKQLEGIQVALEFPKVRHRWNTNEEIASVLIAFEKHKEWQYQDLKIRPASGSMLLYSRNKVRYRKDGYCWKKRKDGKTIREDHMKLKVQGLECIYGSYVHSAILPTFHRRCYWLLQNPDIVLVHYLNVPYPNATKLTIPVVSYAMEKKEWTKDELIDQLRPMFTAGPQDGTEQKMEEIIRALVQQLIDHQEKRNKSHRCDAVCDKTCVHSKNVKISPQQPASQARDLVTSDMTNDMDKHLQPGLLSVIHPSTDNSDRILSYHPAQGCNNVLLAQNSEQNGSIQNNCIGQASLILNLGNISNISSGGLMLLQGQANAQFSVLTNSQNLRQLSLDSSHNAQSHCIHAQNSAQPHPPPCQMPIDTKPQSSESKPPDGLDMDDIRLIDQVDFMNEEQVLKNISGPQDLRSNGLHMPDVQDLLDSPDQTHQIPLPEVDVSHGFENETIMSSLTPTGGCHMDTSSSSDKFSETICDSSKEEVNLGDNLDSLQPSLKSTDLNLDTLDLLDLPDLDRLCNDISLNNINACGTVDTVRESESSLSQGKRLLHNGGPNVQVNGQNDISCLQDQLVKPTGTNVPSNNNSLSVGTPGAHSREVSPVPYTGGLESSMNYPGSPSAVITDFSPDWAFTEGQTKVLVTGPWTRASSSYVVLIDGKMLGTTVVQPGVLRCFVPPHELGLVTLQVACDGAVVSNTVVFEYKEQAENRKQGSSVKDWFSIEEKQLQTWLIEKLQFLESRLNKQRDGTKVCLKQKIQKSSSPETLEDCILTHVEPLTHKPWKTNETYTKSGPLGMTVLHLAAALGYTNLIRTLVHWRSDNPSWLLDYEVDSHSLDDNSCTPLMWACAQGRLEAAITLINWNKDSLKVCNRESFSPLLVARQHGHHSLVDQIEQLGILGSTNSNMFINKNLISSSTLKNSSLKEKSSDFPVSTSTPVFKDKCDIFKTPQCKPPTGKEKSPLRALHIEIPKNSSTPREKISRRQSEQTLKGSTGVTTRHKLKKRLSVDLFPNDAEPSLMTTEGDFQRPIREANSEPHLAGTLNTDYLTRQSNPMLSDRVHDLPSPDMLMLVDTASTLERLGIESVPSAPGNSNQDGNGHLVIQMDTNDGSSDRSHSPYIDVETVSDEESSDDEYLRGRRSQSVGTDDPEDGKRQMITLAKQIIAAMPERIKFSPGACDDLPVDEIERDRSESYSSAPSQPSPHASSYGEDSGISTPMIDGLAFDEYRYPELGTPASSLSPDSTCLHSPYSPYSFQLDSPPPTTAEFTEYFNAPATYMEKDFSQLTLSDREQRKLYEAAKVIQSAYRLYRDKQHQQQRQHREIEAAVLIQSYYRRYKQYAYYKKMTQAAVLIQSQFRSYYAQKRFKKSRDAAVVIQNQYRSYKEHERLKKGGNKTVTQRYRSHYQRKLATGSEGSSRIVQIVPDTADGSQADPNTTPTDDCHQDTSREVTPHDSDSKEETTSTDSQS